MNRPDPSTAAVRALFERASHRLDRDSRERLRRAREDALAGAAANRRRRLGWTGGALAGAALALAVVAWLPRTADAPPAPVAATVAPPMDDPTLAEDPEVYAWLADAPVAAGDGEEHPL